MNRAPRNPSRAAVAKSLSELAVLWKKPPPEKNNAYGKMGEVGKAKNSHDTVTQPATNWQGARHGE